MKYIIGFVIAVILIGGYIYSQLEGNRLGGSVLTNKIGAVATSSTIQISGAGIYTAMATNTGRIAGEICNVGLGGVYLGFGKAPDSTVRAVKGYYLGTKSCYRIIPGENQYTSAILVTASTTESNTAVLTVQEN